MKGIPLGGRGITAAILLLNTSGASSLMLTA